MDISALSNISALTNLSSSAVSEAAKSAGLTDSSQEVEGNLFGTLLSTAMDNLKTTNSYLSDAENEKIKFALGETENTHDLTIAMQKASTALQYTVAIRDRVLEAYREIMNMQI